MYFTQDQIDRANQTDLVSFLQSQGEQLTRAGQEYRWKRHDSLTLRGNKWYRHSQSRGGNPINFVMEFYGRSFTEAVQMLTEEQGVGKPEQTSPPSHGAPQSRQTLWGKEEQRSERAFRRKAETSDTELATTLSDCRPGTTTTAQRGTTSPPPAALMKM